MVEMLNRELIPSVPEQGSLGASGDLAPLANLALPLIGQGELLVGGRERAGRRGARRGRPRADRAGGEGGPGARQRHAGDARGRDPGRPARRRPRACGRRRRGDVGRGGARHRRPVRRTAAAAAPARRSGRVARRTSGGCSRIRRSCRRIATARTWCRTRTRCGARRRCTAPPGTRSRYVEGVLQTEAGAVSRQPDRPARTTTRSARGGNFHGQPVAVALDTLALATVGAREHQRTPPLPAARSEAEQRPSGVPDPGERAELAASCSCSTPRRRSSPSASRSRTRHRSIRSRRGGPGGPREHGHDRRAPRARHRDERRARRRDGGHGRRAGAGPPFAAGAGGRHARRARRGPRRRAVPRGRPGARAGHRRLRQADPQTAGWSRPSSRSSGRSTDRYARPSVTRIRCAIFSGVRPSVPT